LEQIRHAKPDVKGREFSKLLKNPGVYEWIGAHVAFTSPPFTDRIIEEMGKLVAEPDI
jgi:hypothetical protein